MQATTLMQFLYIYYPSIIFETQMTTLCWRFMKTSIIVLLCLISIELRHVEKVNKGEFWLCQPTGISSLHLILIYDWKMLLPSNVYKNSNFKYAETVAFSRILCDKSVVWIFIYEFINNQYDSHSIWCNSHSQSFFVNKNVFVIMLWSALY